MTLPIWVAIGVAVFTPIMANTALLIRKRRAKKLRVPRR